MRRVSAKRTFPRGCGRNVMVADEVMNDGGVDNSNAGEGEIVLSLDYANQFLEDRREYASQVNVQLSDASVGNGSVEKSDVEEGETVELDSCNRFREGSGKYSPTFNASEESVTNGLDYRMKDKVESALEEVDSAMQFSEGCEQLGPQIVAKPSGEGVSATIGSDCEMKVFAAQFDAKLRGEGVSIGSVCEMIVKKEGEPDSGKQSGRSIWSGVLEVGRSLVPDESLEFPSTSTSETVKSMKSLGQLVEPEASKSKKTLESMVNPSGDFEPKMSDLSKNLTDTKLLESMRGSNLPDSKGYPNVVQSEEKELPSSLGMHLPVHSDLSDAFKQCKDSEQPQASFPREDAEQSTHREYPQRTRSAIRDFPAGCGRRALLDTVNECQKPVEYYQDMRLGETSSGNNRSEQLDSSKLKQDDMEKIFFKPSRKNSLPPLYVKSSYSSNKVDKGFRFCREEMHMEFANLSSNSSGKRSIFGKSVYERHPVNKHQFGKDFISEPSDERAAVQGLMAASECSWKQEKVIFTQDTVKVIPTKHIFVARNTSKVSFRNENIEVEDYLSEVDEKDDSALVHRSKNMASSSIPFTRVVNGNSTQAGVMRNKVRESLRQFQIICRKLLRDDEGKPKVEIGFRRIDLEAAKIVREKNKWVNTGNQILGIVPGVEVGDEFHYRVELSIIGLHRPYQGGIDYVHRRGMIVATSIVASGGYDDDMGSTDVLVYSGQGGTPVRGNKMATDQKLVRGNLALKKSMDEGTPVRVIRGYKEVKGNASLDARISMAGIFTYDGLYLVEKYWTEEGRYGNKVFKFQLRRMVGQPELAIKELKQSKKASVRVGHCAKDISQGKEKIPIGAVNRKDDERPPPFKYITRMIHPLHYKPTPVRGCDCTDGCLSSKCLCAIKNGGKLPFNYNGAIVEAKPLVYECGPRCKCPPSCYNRVSQHGIKFLLELFKTESRGWGVRSLNSISSGSFICEYMGELLQDNEAEQRIGHDEYLFDVGHNYNDHAVSSNLSKHIPSDLKSNSSFKDEEDVSGFTIDAAQYGNIGRFINHSCSPNLYAQNVLYDHDDKRMPHIMLFAAENIPPLQELTYHYNMQLDQVYDSNGNIKKKKCKCGSAGCTGRMY
ncbi:hypothetical protein IFM89_032068 [Coptis chinensis]|uniref:Uncharacterized protein n=1 Tax=Coptis chinensis TaxID=261450 RepID=A0A835I6B3_9MAGN|nr:hypothetical protein IFM89_032068 [Coptis chinensis]